MCGKACLSVGAFLEKATPGFDLRKQRRSLNESIYGWPEKAEPFRTSGGKAACAKWQPNKLPAGKE
jgi:hypothetical protein